jgi:hypothetical protein
MDTDQRPCSCQSSVQPPSAECTCWTCNFCVYINTAYTTTQHPVIDAPAALRFRALLSPPPAAALAPSPALLLGLASRFPEAPPPPPSRPAGRFTGGFLMTSLRVAGRPATTSVPSAGGQRREDVTVPGRALVLQIEDYRKSIHIHTLSPHGYTDCNTPGFCANTMTSPTFIS